jgi:hypothetical protein
MAFDKKAFGRRDHKAITKYIMGDRFDPVKFEAVHLYIDGIGGTDHRVKHGHNEEAEREIHKQWGEVGVEIFKIHILSDSLHENLGPIVQTIYNAHMSGALPLPYFTDAAKAQRQSYEISASTSGSRCNNCGSLDTVDPLQSWIGPPVCSQCLTDRHLEVCVQCQAFLSKSVRQPSPENPGRYICPVCAAK